MPNHLSFPVSEFARLTRAGADTRDKFPTLLQEAERPPTVKFLVLLAVGGSWPLLFQVALR